MCISQSTIVQTLRAQGCLRRRIYLKRMLSNDIRLGVR